jgi:hypothetical protein
MAERPTEIGEELISLMLPDVDPELVQLIVRHMASSTAASGRTGHDGQREGRGEDQAGVLQGLVELLTLIRDADIDQAQLSAFLRMDPHNS